MSSQTKVTPTTVSNDTKPEKKKSSLEKLKKQKLRKELERMRRSKQFRELGDMLYLD